MLFRINQFSLHTTSSCLCAFVAKINPVPISHLIFILFFYDNLFAKLFRISQFSLQTTSSCFCAFVAKINPVPISHLIFILFFYDNLFAKLFRISQFSLHTTSSCLCAFVAKKQPALITYLIFILLFSGNLLAQQNSTIDPLQSQVISILNKVESEDRLAGNMNPDSAASLPFGIVKEIGPTRYIIAIDSAKFRTNNATFSAYMALDFPGATQKLCFSAQNIAFNPKGVMPSPNSKLVLVSEHRISMGPHVTMVLKPDGFNYVEWDCNGFTAVNLKGYFEFDPGTIYPDPSSSTDSVVRASFQIHVNDLHNFVVSTSLAPFCIRGIDDMSFTILDATADFSELSNAPNMVFPPGYNLANCNGDPLMWTGFYMRQFRVKLPRELSRNGNRPEIIATNLLIDNSGVSGIFQATNLFSTSAGSMSGWGFSIVSIGASLTSNQLNGGSLSGFIKLPVSETDSIAYAASFFQNLQTHQTDYSFSIAPAANMNAQILSAKLALLNSSTITVSKVNGKFKPIAILNGMLTLNSANAKARGLSFQQLTIASDAPLLRAGIFSLTPNDPDSSRLGGFKFSINSIAIGSFQNQPAIAFNIGLNFTDVGPISLGVNAGFVILTKTQTVADPAAGSNQTKLKWEYDHLRVDNIAMAFNSSVYHLNGTLIFKDDDPIYGKGFYGQIAMTIETVMPAPATSSVWFGNVNNYKYFYVDAAVPVPVPIGGVTIYRFMGGIYYHMHRNGTALQDQLYTNAFGAGSSYVPDITTSLGIKAGVTLGTSGNPKACNGDVALEMNFNSNGGINYLQLNGNVYFMIGISERLNKLPAQVPAIASMVMQYDFQNSAFHAVLGAQLHVPGASGNGTAVIHFDPNLWYVHIGRPQSRIIVNVAGIANFNAYLEVGQYIDPVPSPPQEVTSVVNANGLNAQRNENALANAGGFAFGAGFGTSFGGQVGFEHWYIYYNFAAGAGFDIMVLDYGSNAHCVNSTSPVGFQGWYGSGQIYAYLQGGVGIHGHVVGQDFDFNLVTLSAAAILQAKAPNPSWVGGAMGCDYDVLGGVVSGHCDFAFQVGNQCTILPN